MAGPSGQIVRSSCHNSRQRARTGSPRGEVAVRSTPGIRPDGNPVFFQRFYDRGLAQASYMIGCQETGDAIIVDPNRDVQQYIDAAAREKLRITHVTETHIHADFVS